MCDCDFDITTAIRKGRAYYVCPKCGADVSLYYFIMMEAILEEEKNKQKEK